MEGFQYDAHPMGIFISTVGALSTLYRDAKLVFDQESRNRQCLRLVAKVASIAGYAYRHSIGRDYVYPDNDLSFTGNFLNMLFKMTELKYRPNPVLERALDVLFILHADHEQNCSTTAMRVDRQLARRSLLGHRRRGGRALRSAARRRERSRAADARGDRHHQERAGVHHAREGRRRPADGLRPSRLQVRTIRGRRSSSGLPMKSSR